MKDYMDELISKLAISSKKMMGIEFSNYLETKWAIFFESLGLEWNYKPCSIKIAGGLEFMPTFWLPCPRYHS
jgi:hypothetical protein|tara:strand:- start:3709 stop:3924 length:216 start_codon:yes stop_codon:yes gene_type:complete